MPSSGSLVGVLVLVAIPVLLLGAVSPWAIRLAVSSVEEAGTVAGRLYALSTAGSLVGTLVSALLLIPLVGTRRTFLIFALAIALMAVAGLRPVGRWALAPAAIAALIALPVGTLKADTEDGGRVIHEAETEYQYARVIEYPDSERTLELTRARPSTPSAPPSASPGQAGPQRLLGAHRGRLGRPPRAAVRRPQRAAAARRDPRQRGGHDVARLRGVLPRRVDGVEIDAELSDIGREYFDMNNPRLQLYHEERGPFLRRTDARYDVISVDAYRQPYIPFYLTTVEFFETVRDRLAPGGVLIVNAGHPEGQDDLEKVLTATIGDVFPNVLRDPIEDTNTLIVASERPLSAARLREAVPDLPAGLRDRWRRGPDRGAAWAARSTPTTRRRWSGSSTSRSSTTPAEATTEQPSPRRRDHRRGIVGCAAAASWPRRARGWRCSSATRWRRRQRAQLGGAAASVRPGAGGAYRETLGLYRSLEDLEIADEPVGVLLLAFDAAELAEVAAEIGRDCPSCARDAARRRAAGARARARRGAQRVPARRPATPCARGGHAAFALRAYEEGVVFHSDEVAWPGRAADGCTASSRGACGERRAPCSWRRGRGPRGRRSDARVEPDRSRLGRRRRVPAGRRRGTSSRRWVSRRWRPDARSRGRVQRSHGGRNDVRRLDLPQRGADPDAWVGAVRARAATFLPALSRARPRGVRACARPQSLDGRPLVGEAEGVEGLWVAAGHGPWGISTGPATARLVVDAIRGHAEVPAALSVRRLR